MTPLEQRAALYREKRLVMCHEQDLKPSPYELEIICYNDHPHGDWWELKAEFLRGMMRMRWPDNPTICQFENGEFKNYWVYRITDAICRYRCLTLLGCASATKTHTTSLCVYNVFAAMPWETSVLLSTTSGEAAESRVWGTMKNVYRYDKHNQAMFPLEYKKAIVLQMEADKRANAIDRDYRNSIHLVLIKPGSEGDNALAAISGRKNKKVIWVKDEAQLMTNDCRQAELNLLSNPFCQIIELGNAPKEGTQFYETCKPFGEGYEAGYRSIDLENATGWPTRTGYCLWFDGEKSPNMQSEEGTLFPGVIDRKGIAMIELRSGGRDTPGYWTQVRGFPHSSDIQDTVLTEALIQVNSADKLVIWRGDPVTTLGGFDIGFTADGDPCVLDFIKMGYDINGRIMGQFEPHTHVITPSSESKLPFEQQIASKVIEQCDERGCSQVCCDVSGDGGTMMLEMQKMAPHIRFIPVSFGGSPSDTPIGNGDDRLCSDVYDRKVTEIWYNLRFAVQAGVIRGMNLTSRAVQQLCQRKVVQQGKGKKIAVETKKEMKKRIRRSPDDGDARSLAFFCARQNGLSASIPQAESDEPEEDAPTEEAKPQRYEADFHTKERYGSGRVARYQ